MSGPILSGGTLSGGGGGGDGAILDGALSSIKATVKDYVNSNPLATILVDTNGDPISVGGGTQYAEDTASTAGEIVTMAGVVRQDVRGTLVDATGDRTELQVNSSGDLRVDGSAVTQPVSIAGTVVVSGPLTDAQLRASAVPISAASLPLPTGASTEATLALIKAKTDNLDVALSTRTKPADSQHVTVDNASIAITAAALPLPSGAATEATLATRLADATFTARINTLGQKTMANSTPVVIASDQTAIPITGSISATSAATATANDPSYVEASSSALSQDLTGHLRVILDSQGAQNLSLLSVLFEVLSELRAIHMQIAYMNDHYVDSGESMGSHSLLN